MIENAYSIETMDQFLTDGGRAQPIAVFTNSNGDVLGKWGPQPQYIQTVMEMFRHANPDREATEYQEKIALKRKEIADIYNSGTEYQTMVEVQCGVTWLQEHAAFLVIA